MQHVDSTSSSVVMIDKEDGVKGTALDDMPTTTSPTKHDETGDALPLDKGKGKEKEASAPHPAPPTSEPVAQAKAVTDIGSAASGASTSPSPVESKFAANSGTTAISAKFLTERVLAGAQATKDWQKTPLQDEIEVSISSTSTCS